MKPNDRSHRILEHPRLPTFAVVVAVLLCTPSLWLGLQVDDYILRLELMEDPPDPLWSRSAARVFAFFNGDEELTRSFIAGGSVPWWTHPKLKLAFFRPLTGLTHWLDFRLWPELPWLMHVQSLLWFAGAVFAAAMLYRRLLSPAWVAGLAALLFAVEDSHGIPAAWLANRNATIGVFFGLVALIGHDRWRRNGWRPGAIIGPLALLCGMLAGEIALAAGGYLLAHAIFLDTHTWPRRLAALAPAGTVGVAWWVAYRSLGFGANGSGVYIDPGITPLLFARAVVERAPLLFSGQWAVPANLSLMFSENAARVLWWGSVGLTLVVAALLLPILKRDRVARFFALGMVLALVPACATFPDDRLLFFAGFGGLGLLAQLLASVWQGTAGLPATRIRQLPLRAACWVLVTIHFVIAPLSLLFASAKVRMVGAFIEHAAESLPSDPAVVNRTVVIVNAPSAFVTVYGPLIQALRGRHTPHRTLTLSTGISPTTVTRTHPNVLTVRPEAGFLAPPGSPQPGREAAQAAFDPRYFYQMLDRLYRDATPIGVGERLAYGGTAVEVMDATKDGRPAEVSFGFGVELEHPSLVWLQWDHGVYAPFEPPRVGESTILPPVTLPW